MSLNNNFNYIDVIPAEILKLIFSFLRISDLQSASSVCKFWSSTVVLHNLPTLLAKKDRRPNQNLSWTRFWEKKWPEIDKQITTLKNNNSHPHNTYLRIYLSLPKIQHKLLVQETSLNEIKDLFTSRAFDALEPKQKMAISRFGASIEQVTNDWLCNYTMEMLQNEKLTARLKNEITQCQRDTGLDVKYNVTKFFKLNKERYPQFATLPIGLQEFLFNGGIYEAYIQNGLISLDLVKIIFTEMPHLRSPLRQYEIRKALTYSRINIEQLMLLSKEDIKGLGLNSNNIDLAKKITEIAEHNKLTQTLIHGMD